MGQRSQIYVRFTRENGEKYLYARYYGWNYGERMVSRAKHSLEWIQSMKDNSWVFIHEPQRLIRILDTNFDMQDVVISSDLIKEWDDDFSEENFNDYIFKWADNNDGELFIDIKEGENIIKYAFTDGYQLDRVMSAAQYMQWNHKKWRDSKYISKEQKSLCEKNIRQIPRIAKLMTKQELDEFISCDYGYKSHSKPINYDLPIYAIYDGDELIFTTTDEHQAYKMVNNINNDGGCGYYTIQ